jgi:D-glycero-alpha-D-manno-heptose-7-phosphate kinase
LEDSVIIVRAPVRISFGGGGTDLAAYYERFGGFVVSAAITRYCYVVAREPVSRGIRINSADYRIWEAFGPGEVPPVAEPLALPKAAIEWFADRGLREQGVDLFLASEVPPGTGLGSSSAMAVALVSALASYTGMPFDRPQAAELASCLEIDRLDMPIGKQDQYASAFGGLNAIAFATGGVRVEPLNLPPDMITALNSRLLLFSTGRSRDSAAILREQRASTRTDRQVIASLHRIKALAGDMRQALIAEDLDRFGQLLDLGWQEKKRLSARVSSSVIDEWYGAAREAGALGGKIAGAGGGGFLLLYCPSGRQRSVRAAMARLGLPEFTFDFDYGGAQVLSDLPAGAGRLAMLVNGT